MMRTNSKIVMSCVGAMLGSLGLCLLCLPWCFKNPDAPVMDADYEEVERGEF